jgi:predicted restriction endonuclease
LQALGVLLRRAAELGLCIPETPLAIFQEKVNTTIQDEGIVRGTEAERLVRQRIGQGCYRNAHMEYWGSACAVTGVDIPELLRASHAKPWAECASDSDRLNVYNGFLLSANIDALFDKGLVSFSDEGAMLLSQKIAPHRFKAAGIGPDISLRWIDGKHLPFLRWHREHLFEKNFRGGLY